MLRHRDRICGLSFFLLAIFLSTGVLAQTNASTTLDSADYPLGGASNTAVLAFTPGVINTVAGHCVMSNNFCAMGYGGDGGSATAALLMYPYSVAFDAAGNLYVADAGNNIVRKVNATTGIISTVAGKPQQAGYGGDGGPATGALLNFPEGITFDAAGNLYISDTRNSVIRKVDATAGNISTIAGAYSCSGGVCGGYGGDGGLATSALLAQPMGIALDSAGNLYIADYYNSLIRKVAATTHIISKVAGFCSKSQFGNCQPGWGGDGGPATSALLWYPMGVAVDSANNIYIADNDNFVVRKVAASTGIITTVAGTHTNGYGGDGGPATNAVLGQPTNVALDAAGNLYIVDSTSVVRKVDAHSGNISTVAGVYRYNSVTVGWGGYAGDGGAATNALICEPYGIGLDAAGNVYIADSVNGLVRKVGPHGYWDFGSQVVGATGTATFVLYNAGNAPLNFNSGAPTVTGDYALASESTCAPGRPSAPCHPPYFRPWPRNTCNFTQSLSPGAHCSLPVTFRPTATGTRSGTIQFDDDGVGTPQQINLIGRGNLIYLTPSSVNFGAAGITTSATATVTVHNVSRSAMALSTSITPSGSDFSFGSGGTCGASLAANSSCTYNLVFTPTSATQEGATLTVTGGSYSITAGLSGTGTTLFLTPLPLSFGSVVVGNGATLAVTVHNTSNGSVSLSSSILPTNTDFSIGSGGTCVGSLAAVSTCTYNVIFTPAAIEIESATLTVSGGPPATDLLQGAGVKALGSVESTTTASPSAVNIGGSPSVAHMAENMQQVAPGSSVTREYLSTTTSQAASSYPLTGNRSNLGQGPVSASGAVGSGTENQAARESSTDSTSGTAAPRVVTLPAMTSANTGAVVINGAVNPNGLPTTYWFEYYTRGTHFTSSPSQSLPDGTAQVAVSGVSNALRPHTTYYFRVAASNSVGTSRGEILSFQSSGGGEQPHTATANFFGTQSPGDYWTWAETTSNGSVNFAAANNTQNKSYSGTATRLSGNSTGFTKLDVTSSTDPTITLPATAYEIEIPGTMLMAATPPFGIIDPTTSALASQHGPVVAASQGSCPANGTATNVNWILMPTSDWCPANNTPNMPPDGGICTQANYAYGTAAIAVDANGNYAISTTAYHLNDLPSTAGRTSTLSSCSCSSGLIQCTDPSNGNSPVRIAFTPSGIFIMDTLNNGVAGVVQSDITTANYMEFYANGNAFRGIEFYAYDNYLDVGGPVASPLYITGDGTKLNAYQYTDVDSGSLTPLITSVFFSNANTVAPGLITTTFTNCDGSISNMATAMTKVGGQYIAFSISYSPGGGAGNCSQYTHGNNILVVQVSSGGTGL